MTRKIKLFVCAIFGVGLIASSIVYYAWAGEFRFWTTAQGRKSNVKLKVVEQTGDSVKLQREDNDQTVDIPLDRLSKDDRDYLRKLDDKDFSSSNQTTSDNWPRFRGPSGSGISNAKELPAEWSATQNIVWQQKLPGPGASSPIIWGDHVYVTCYSEYGLSPQSPGDGNKADLKRHLVCIHRDTGRILWDKAVSAEGNVFPYEDHPGVRYHGYATHTPVADESGVYVFYGTTGVIAYSHSGEQRWQKPCGTKTGGWGTSSSPILYGDLLIVHAIMECGSLIAFDKHTGQEKWRRGEYEKPGTWGTPAVINLNGRANLVYGSGPYGLVAGLDPLRGTKLWEGGCGVSSTNVCPVAHDNTLFFLAGPGSQAAALQVDKSGNLKQLWKLTKGSYVSSPIYHDGHLYWARETGGVVYCVDAKTGEVCYEQRLRPLSGDIYASPILADGKLYYISRTKGIYVVAAKPEFELLAHNVIETDKTVFNGSPAVSGERIFLRSNQSLYCIGTMK